MRRMRRRPRQGRSRRRRILRGSSDLVAQVRSATEGMQFLGRKLTALSSNLPALTVAAKAGGADAVCMMGRFMAMVPDLETFDPVLGTSAAYGGGWALPIVCRFLALSRRAVGAGLPLLGTNGVRSGGDVARMAPPRASATELCSVVMHEGFGGLTWVIAELDALLAAREGRFDALVGRAADALHGYGEQAEMPGRVAGFRSARNDRRKVVFTTKTRRNTKQNIDEFRAKRLYRRFVIFVVNPSLTDSRWPAPHSRSAETTRRPGQFIRQFGTAGLDRAAATPGVSSPSAPATDQYAWSA